jgi:hypothetical protein
MSPLGGDNGAAVTIDGKKSTVPFHSEIDPRGLVRGKDGSLWAYFIMPLVPFDFRSEEDRLEVGRPIMQAFDRIGRLGRAPVGESRRGAKPREIHLVGYSWQQRPETPTGLGRELTKAIDRWFLGMDAVHRAQLLGVELWRDDGRAGQGEDDEHQGLLARTYSQTVDSLERLWVTYAADPADFTKDIARVTKAVMSCGGKPLGREFKRERERLTAWYNNGRGTGEWSEESADESALIISPERSGHQIRFFGLTGMDPELAYAPRLPFVHGAMTHEPGVAMVSVRAKLQHWNVSRARANRSRINTRAVAAESAASGELQRAELEQQIALGNFVENYYSINHEYALAEASVVFAEIAPKGHEYDDESWHDFLEDVYGITVAPLKGKLMISALLESLPASHYRVAPYRPFNNDFNAGFIAYSAMNAGMRLGDETGYHFARCLPEFQPIYMDPMAAARENANATVAVTGSLGSGKTFAATTLALQATVDGHPVVFVNPKDSPSYKYLADRLGWAYVHLTPKDETRGSFDPFRFTADIGVACDIVLEYILGIFSLASKGGLGMDQQVTLGRAIREAKKNEARCTWDIIKEIDDPELRGLIEDWFDTSPIAGVGVSKTPVPPPRLGDNFRGILIEFGPDLRQPDAGAEPQNIYESTNLAVMRLIGRIGTEMLIARRGGLMIIDEAHAFFDGSPATRNAMDGLSRRVRSYGILLFFLTQSVSDIVRHSMDAFIGRWIVFGTEKREERIAGLEKCGFDPEDEGLIERLSPHLANPRPKSSEFPQGRPAFGIHRDLNGKFGTIMVTPIADEVMKLLSNRHEDEDRRAAEQQTSESR